MLDEYIGTTFRFGRAYGLTEQVPQGSLYVFTSTIPHGEDEYIVFS
jgi:hypothetical protein